MTAPDWVHPYVGMDVPTLLARRVASRADHPFLIWDPPEGPQRVWTYAEFSAEVSQVAAGLAARGVKAGDRLIIHLNNCPEFLFSWFACATLGAVAVTTNTRSAGAEFAYFAQDSQAVAAITQPAYADMVSRHAPQLRWVVCIDHDPGAGPDAAYRPDRASSFASLRAAPATPPPRRPAEPLAPMSVQYTSGTTSRPKGVLWTHANALWGGQVSSGIEDLRPDDIHFVCNPLFHTNALSYGMLATMWAGSTMVLVPKWSTSRFWEVSLRHGCTWMSIITFTYNAIIDMEVPPDSRYRLMGLGVCDLPTDARLGVKTLGWWGMTETVSLPIAGDARLPNTPMSMGRPVPQYQVAVVAEDGTPVSPGEMGKLLVKGTRGISLFAEYLNQPETTAACFDADGWFDSGDMVTLLPDGHLQFENREKDMLKVGAENVAASEVERVILGVPGVKEAAVVGQPHRMLSEVPVAFVIGSQADPEAILAACRQGLADFKVPREVYVVDELPRAELGKINKATLRRQVAGAAVS